MRIAGCLCAGRLGNSGYPTVKPFGVTAGFIKVPLLADDGTRNKIDLTSTDIPGDILALINNADPSKRGYPYLGLKNVVPNEADPEYQTADNGERFKLRDGVKTITFEVWGVTEQFYGKTAAACVEFGLLALDNCGNLKGEKDGDYLYPRAVNKDSFNSKFMDRTNAQQGGVMFEMDYSILTNDGDQWMIPFTEFEPYNVLELKGMIDVNFTLVEVTDSTTFVMDMQFGYGSAVDPLPWRGATLADITLYNETDGAAVPLDSVTQSATVPGRYTIVTSAAVDATDSVTIDAFKAATGNGINGYEGDALTFQYSWT